MNEVLIITGACGVGKTATARVWAKAKQGVAIETDYFTEWIYDDSLERFTREEEKLVANLSLVTAKEYLAQKMPVAIEGVWSPYGLSLLHSGLKKKAKNAKLKFVWLYCEISENHRRDELRVSENQMKQRVDIVSQQLQSYHWENYVHHIDTTYLTLPETLAAIESK
ncbi:MAG: hypothetical protein WBA23_04800 [Tunicatimonas sp.]|uniref:hypothetical protein n=1 Tax=Tunicatimonas sp. TaxID=1940096 RepID=UPI003C7471ED